MSCEFRRTTEPTQVDNKIIVRVLHRWLLLSVGNFRGCCCAQARAVLQNLRTACIVVAGVTWSKLHDHHGGHQGQEACVRC